MKIIKDYAFILGFLLFNTLFSVQAAPLAKEDVPEPLKPWVDWVLYEQDQQTCPHAYNGQQRFCAWPSALKLELDNEQGQFSQHWQVQTESWVRLPGNGKQWPHDVEVDSIAAVVVNHKGFPAVKLSPGEHEVSGGFQWDSIPESLTIPPSTGLIQITRNGLAIDFPRINKQGQLWLDKSLQEKNVEDALDVQVYRKINDGHPLRVETRLILHVSGRSRDVVFPKLQLADFTPLNLRSPLPARVNQQGDLQVQVRPGNWTIDLVSYRAEMVDELSLPDQEEAGKDAGIASTESLPKQEVWVFQANPSLRLAEISGVPAVDSRQTRLPKAWQAYPAYLLDAKQTMQLKTLQRGSASPEPNRLSLQRAMWMDFDGKGYTIQDKLKGTMTRGWRLVSAPEIELGSVRIDGEPQFITTLKDGSNKGVEVRRGQINLEAASRYTESLSDVPVSGWKHDFQQVNTRLYLAPGWKLFSAHGADNLPNTWLQRWTLFDLFTVLIIAVAIGRLWDWKWGVFALLTMTLIWHEPGAPKYIWLNLIAAIALLRVLPDGMVKKLVWWYRNATFLALLLIVIPFVVAEVRNGLYPQLGLYSDYDSTARLTGSSVGSSKDMILQDEMEKARRVAQSSLSMDKNIVQYDMPNSKVRNVQNANQMVDPNANIQTGPGLPTWNWQEVHFQWNSPVNETQTLSLNLISPRMNFFLNILRVVLLLLLIGRLLRVISKNIKPGKPKKPLHRFANNTASILLPLALIVGSMAGSLTLSSNLHAEDLALQVGKPNTSNRTSNHSPSLADFPDQPMLQILKDRLLAPDECLPDCAQIEAMRLELSEQLLTIYLKVHIASEGTTKIAIPLPGNIDQWRAERVLMENQPVHSISRDATGVMWLGLGKGIHNVVMQGRLPRQPQVQLSLPLRPKYVEWQGEGWTVEGIRENNIPAQQIQLVRKRQNESESDVDDLTSDSNYLPPLLHIERTVHLGLDWLVDTRVTRLSPTGSPISMKIPLLADESVLSNAYTVKDGKVMINMSSTQRSIHWSSQLPVRDELQLAATQTTGLLESWKLDISPIWHVEISGIPEIHHANQNAIWLPEWQPWPGEKVQLNITRPKGIVGRTMTIQRSILNTKVGKRLRESELTLQLRSSRGGQHPITLPENAELISVKIDGKLQPVRQQQRSVSLPIVPGKQRIDVKWRVDEPISQFLKVLPVDVGIDNVNNSIHLKMGRDRWILFTNGPTMGPAVLFWGVLLVILIGSVILGKIKDSPLRIWQWFLLGTGLSLATPIMIIVVVGWLLAMNYRPQLRAVENRLVFNAGQVLLVLLTLVALGSLIVALQQGLLGWPDMQISGNSSTAWELRWYQDRSLAELPQPWVLSVPLLAYRVLMLLWALWLAFSLINWLRNGWQNFSEGGLWRPGEKKPRKKDQKKDVSTDENPAQ